MPAPRPPTDPPANHRKNARLAALITSGIIILFYGASYRWLFATDLIRQFGNAGGVVSLSFVFSVPFACGFLSVAIGRFFGSDNWLVHAVALPGGSLAIGLILSVIFQFEAMICVMMAAPILFFGVILGGLIAHQFLPRNGPPPGLQVTLAVFLPFVAAWFEGSLHWPSETKSITNTIDIQAPAAQIWPEIASVRAIDPREIRNRWIYLIGFPKPIAATLDQDGVGGVRVATFERGVSFFEVVTAWDKHKSLSFTIHADPAFIPRTAFDQHIIVGGRFYDVLDGTYRIEPLSPTTSRLHLTSNHRLSTRFNAYAGWWSVKIMDQIQGSILEVVRKRAELDDWPR
jgi:hypothetical protein